MILVYTLLLFIGLVFGSFLSVLVSRLDNKEGIISGRSECPKCLTRLKWYDLIPLFSFAELKGKCRYCKEKISFLYPFMEVSVAGSFLLYYAFKGPFIDIFNIYELVIIFLLLALAFFDYSYLILPDKIVFTGIGLVLCYYFIFQRMLLLNGLLAGLGLGGFFAIIYLTSRGEWMGFGDVKLAFLIGLILGYPVALISMMSSIWAGAIWGIVMMATKKANLKTALPFGTFICAIAILFIIFNEYIKIKI